MIPKVIHLIWFGGKTYPEMVQRCVDSWKTHLPDYKIIYWNEETFDITSNAYVHEAYESKKFAFVSDYVRLYALYNYGGIYMDTDVQVVKSLDPFLNESAFMGFENYLVPGTGIMACEKGNLYFKNMLDEYADIHFVDSEGNLDMTTNVVRICRYLKKLGLKFNNKDQIVANIRIFNNLCFSPEPEEVCMKRYQDKIFTIHHRLGSWMEKTASKQSGSVRTKMRIKTFFGKKTYECALRTIRILDGTMKQFQDVMVVIGR